VSLMNPTIPMKRSIRSCAHGGAAGVAWRNRRARRFPPHLAIHGSPACWRLRRPSILSSARSGRRQAHCRTFLPPAERDSPDLSTAIASLIGTDAGRCVLPTWAKVAPVGWGASHAADLIDSMRSMLRSWTIRETLLLPSGAGGRRRPTTRRRG
jgi:hypothetical protein